MCEACDTFDVEIAIHGPQPLRTLVGKVRAADGAGTLRGNEFESSRALIGQPPFSELDLDTEAIPDVIRYDFECPTYDAVFGLLVDTFHDQGGKWSKL